MIVVLGAGVGGGGGVGSECWEGAGVGGCYQLPVASNISFVCIYSKYEGVHNLMTKVLEISKVHLCFAWS